MMNATSSRTLSSPSVVVAAGGHTSALALPASVPGAAANGVSPAHLPMELVTAAAAAGDGPTVYVEPSTGELTSVMPVGAHGAANSANGGLQLTTITVAVPAPLSPSDTQSLLAGEVALPTHPLPPALAALPQASASAVTSAPSEPASPDGAAYKWNAKEAKVSGSSLVSSFFIFLRENVRIPRCMLFSLGFKRNSLTHIFVR